MAVRFLAHTLSLGRRIGANSDFRLAGVMVMQARQLYGPEPLGLQGFVNNQERTKRQFGEMAERFKTRMVQFMENDAKSMVFTEDLKNMVYLADGKPGEVDLVVKMIKRFHSQNKALRFGGFVFGPIVMRLFHHLDCADIAYAAIQDPDLAGFFDQVSSHVLCMNLLYKQGRFADCMKVMDLLLEKQFEHSRFPRNATNIVMAACYKLNTPESLQYAKNLFLRANEAGSVPSRRSLSLAAALALKQNAERDAAEMLSVSPQQNYVTVRNLKMMALAALERPEDALSILNGVLESDNPDASRRCTITKECMSSLEQLFSKVSDQELVSEFHRMKKGLTQLGETFDQSLDTLLTAEIIDTGKPSGDRRESGVLAASFDRRRDQGGFAHRRGPRRQSIRPGLAEMD